MLVYQRVKSTKIPIIISSETLLIIYEGLSSLAQASLLRIHQILLYHGAYHSQHQLGVEKYFTGHGRTIKVGEIMRIIQNKPVTWDIIPVPSEFSWSITCQLPRSAAPLKTFDLLRSNRSTCSSESNTAPMSDLQKIHTTNGVSSAMSIPLTLKQIAMWTHWLLSLFYEHKLSDSSLMVTPISYAKYGVSPFELDWNQPNPLINRTQIYALIIHRWFCCLHTCILMT